MNIEIVNMEVICWIDEYLSELALFVFVFCFGMWNAERVVRMRDYETVYLDS